MRNLGELIWNYPGTTEHPLLCAHVALSYSQPLPLMWCGLIGTPLSLSLSPPNTHPEVLERQCISSGIQLPVQLHQCALVRVQLYQGVMLSKHLDNHLCAISVSGPGHLKEPGAAQAVTVERQGSVLP